MLDRFEKPLRIVCMILAAMVVLKASRIAFKKNPLNDLRIPEVPTLSINSAAQPKPGAATNTPVAVKPPDPPTVATTNGAAGTTPANSAANGSAPASNVVAQASTKATNTAPATPAPSPVPPNIPAMPNVGGMPGPGGGAKPSTLSPAIQARVQKITDSEILAQVVRPAPMALFGIAGDSAFLRSPSGQTGVIKEGEELGGIKLIKIGFNRVLIEHEGQKKELMIFSGFGGESLLPKDNKETPK